MKKKTSSSILIAVVIIAGFASVAAYLAMSSYLDSYGKSVFCQEDYLMTVMGKCRPGGPISLVDEVHDSRLLIVVGKPIDHHGLAPITTVQITASDGEPITKIIDRTYHPTNFGNRQLADLGTSWDLVPGHQRINMEIVDQDNADAIDHSKNPSFARIQPLYKTSIMCDDGNQEVKILYGAPLIIPIRDGIHTVYDRNLVDGLLPNENNQYVLSFASFFRQEVELPDTATTLSRTSETCYTDIQHHETTYYDRVVFEMENPLKDNYVAPVLNFGTDKASYAKGDIVVVSGSTDKILQHDEMILQVVEPTGDIISIDLIQVEQDGRFTNSIETDRPSWNKNGTYTVKIQYGKDITVQQAISFTVR